MSLIDLYINDSGTIRRIGDNCHDQLTIDEDGRLRYYNLQNGDGCTLGVKREHDECFYEFVSNVDEYGFNCDPREADTPQTDCGKCEHWKYIAHEWQCEAMKCQKTPQTDIVFYDYEPGTDNVRHLGWSSGIKTDCGWKRGEDNEASEY